MPFLEGLAPRRAGAQGTSVNPFAIFFRQANGVAAAPKSELVPDEPERFWPRELGRLTPQGVEGRALVELADHLGRLLVVGNVNLTEFPYLDGHSWGALQGLTARGPVVPGAGPDAEADGESIDHRIGRELNPGGRDSLFLYAGPTGGYLGGPCISYRASGKRRAAIHDPLLGYQLVMGLDEAQLDGIVTRRRSANDYVRRRLAALRRRPELSEDDRRRLDMHAEAVRDVERTLTCRLATDRLAELEGLAAGHASADGDQVLAAVRAHMEVATLAVACGYTRSVAIQVGAGDDGRTRYRNLETGAPMENYHFVSHRRRSHAPQGGEALHGAADLHHMVDIQFARTYRHLLDRLAAYEVSNGERLVDRGVSVWYNDLATGPGHGGLNVPYVLAGRGAGLLVEGGRYVEVEPGLSRPNHARMLNTIGAAAGLRTPEGRPIDDFGDPSSTRTPFAELMV